MKQFFTLVVLLPFLTIGQGCGKSHSAGSKDPPNVLFILADQFRQDIAGVYGGQMISTPHIDRLAHSGILFDHAISSYPMCTPYRGMLMTGKHPTHTGILVNFVNATALHYHSTLGELFAGAGYKTGYIGKWHLGAGGWTNYGNEPNGKRGIDLENNYIPPGPARMGFDHWEAYNFHMQFNNYYYWANSPEQIQTGAYETDIQVSQAIGFMENHKNTNQPFFLVLSTHPPHPPFTAEASPEGYLDQIPEEIKWNQNVPQDNPQTTEAMRYYLAMSKNIDDNVGRLMAWLKDSGLDQNTIVIFTSDHGEMHGSHGYLYKQKPYAESLHVPLIFRWPERLPAGIRKNTPFTPVDFLPTLCGLAGIEVPEETDGENLSRILMTPGKEKDRAVLTGNYVSDYNTFSTGGPFPEWRGVYTGDYTYVRWLSGEKELYDNASDPFQMNNLMDNSESSGQAEAFEETLKKLLKEADDAFLPGTAYQKWFDADRYPIPEMIPGMDK